MSSHPYLDQGIAILHTRLHARSVINPANSRDTRRPFLTLSRETCAGATALGEHLVPLLNAQFGESDRSWMFLDKDLLTRALSEHHLPEYFARFLPEDRVSEIQGLIGEIVGLHPPLWELEHRVAEAILQIAQLGCVIFAGRAAHLITCSLPGGIHVRLVAPIGARIQRLQSRRHCDPVTAAGVLRETDRARARYVRDNFGVQIDDPHSYDLVINTDHITTDTAAQLVLTAMQARVETLAAQSG